MRTSFELKILAKDITEAKQEVIKRIASFLDLPEEGLLDHVSLELKVSYPEAKTQGEITQNMDLGEYVVTAYGSVNQSATKPFGL